MICRSAPELGPMRCAPGYRWLQAPQPATRREFGLALDLQSCRPVVLHRAPEPTAEQVAHWTSTLQALAVHDGIHMPRVLAHGTEEDGGFFLVLEPMPGTSVLQRSTLLRGRGKSWPRTILHLGSQVCRVVAWVDAELGLDALLDPEAFIVDAHDQVHWVGLARSLFEASKNQRSAQPMAGLLVEMLFNLSLPPAVALRMGMRDQLAARHKFPWGLQLQRVLLRALDPVSTFGGQSIRHLAQAIERLDRFPLWRPTADYLDEPSLIH